MAGSTSQVSVTTTAGLAVTGAQETSGAVSNATLTNRGATDLYLGFASNVTSTTGYLLKAGESFSLDLYPGDTVYVLTASGTTTVHTVLVDH